MPLSARAFFLLRPRMLPNPSGRLLATAARSTAPSGASPVEFGWKDYFMMRKNMKRWEMASGLLMGFGALQASSFYFLFVAKYDPTALVFGMDPAMMYVLGIIGLGAVGYVVGNLGATPLYRAFKNRSVLDAFDRLDAQFLRRIQKWRPSDLTSVGASDNVRHLDFYGERIGSVKGYRAWLKIQRDFKKTGRLPHRLGG
ncbi:TIM23 complex component [Kappamyces sp. JEL0829]|nr:TIM23 complex component [Kappamyces sp. JEL0829]